MSLEIESTKGFTTKDYFLRSKRIQKFSDFRQDYQNVHRRYPGVKFRNYIGQKFGFWDLQELNGEGFYTWPLQLEGR